MKNSQGWYSLSSSLRINPIFKRRLDMMGFSIETATKLKTARSNVGSEVARESPKDFEQFDILYFDDDLSSLRLVGIFFWIYGINCQGVLCGRDGFKKLEQHMPYLLLVDTILPDIIGYEIYQLVRTTPRLKAIPTIFLSVNPIQYINKYRNYPDGCPWAPFHFKDLKLNVLMIKRLKGEKV